MKKNLSKCLSLLLATLILLSSVSVGAAAISFGNTVSISGKSEWISGFYYDFQGTSLGTHKYGQYQYLHTADNRPAYCIEPNVTVTEGNKTVAQEFASLSDDQMKLMIAAFIYGYSGSTKYGQTWQTEYSATQAIVWAIVLGHFNASTENTFLTHVFNGSTSSANKSSANTVYQKIKSQILTHYTRPSFTSPRAIYADSNIIELKYNASTGKYEGSVTDNNGVLAGYTFSMSGVTFTKNGNTLKISTSKVLNKATVTSERTSNTYTNNLPSLTAGYAVGSGQTTAVCVDLKDPVNAYFSLTTEAVGKIKIVKTAEDGKISGISFTITGNGVNKSVKTASDGTITVGELNAGTYTVTENVDGIYNPQNSQTVTVLAGQTSTVTFNNTLKRGNLTVTKIAEDGFLEGHKFHLYGKANSGDAIDAYAVTDSTGKATFSNILIAENLTLEEVGTDIRYIVPDSQTVAVEWNKVTNATFTNTLKRGSLVVTKTAEDGFLEGHKFHLYGTSLSGIEVNEYAVTDKDGIAKFNDILISSGYTVEEVETATRYVVPDRQTVNIEWKKVTNASFNNTLKKFRIKVTKEDIEKGVAQGNATLSGAVYGLYKGNELVATYTTNSNASFTTDYYPCGTDWTIREISASEGYLVNNKTYKVGAEPKQYTVEINAINSKVQEQVIKGKISIIKHTDDGSTQIETPEKNAEFQVYLKSAGSYAKAKDYEKDTIICDEDGFASTKLLPYGIYTVHQTKGWDGRELIKDFDVFINKDGKNYKYLINNANFYSYLKVVKVDKETNKQIASAGAGFEIYDSDGHIVSMKYTYPEVNEITTFYTNNEGYLITPEKLPYGDYTLVEVQAPYGYVLNDTPIPFSITPDNASSDTGVTVVKVTAKDVAQKGIIEVVKAGEIFFSVNEHNDFYTPVYEASTLSGAVFNVYAAEDIVTPDGTVRVAKGKLVDTITTDSSGNAKTKALYLGKYELVEVKTPDTFISSKNSVCVDLSYDNQTVSVTSTSISIINERQKVKVSLQKELEKDTLYNVGSDDYIVNVKFGVFADEDIKAADGSVIPKNALIASACCNSDGIIHFDCDLPIGYKFYVKEITTDNHYILSDKHFNFNTAYKGNDVSVIDISIDNNRVIVNNLKRGNIIGIKVDEHNQPLENALIGLFSINSYEFNETTAIATVLTDEDGAFAFENVPYGEWLVKEINAPTGYVLIDTCYVVHISDNEETFELQITNYKVKGGIQISKTDVSSGEALAGVGFRIYDKDKNVIAEGFTDENGICTFSDLEYGEYFYQEFSCSEAYILDDSLYPFSIAEDGVVIKAEMSNKMKRGQLIIHKVDVNNKALAGVEFTVTEKDGNVIAVKKTDDTGIVTFDLLFGEYLWYESNALNGYILDSTKHELSITQDGQTFEFEVTNSKIPVEIIEIPKTGDINPTKYLIPLTMISAVTLAVTTPKLKKKKETENEATNT